MASLILSIIGLIGTGICLIMDMMLIPVATWFMLIGLGGAGGAIYLSILMNIFYFIAFSLPICCCVHESGYKCSAIMLLIGVLLGFILVIMVASSQADVDSKCEERFEDDSSNQNNCEDILHNAFPTMYAVVIMPSIWALLTFPALWMGKSTFGAPAVGETEVTIATKA
uniref:Transmembrane protein n=1 Tax=Octactis speculum TaxID=3111310 RepID=A0A7S2GYP3_9STRA|mmetsp:Transcript_59490/g.81283  ORF Transcript_59490/g.81283 Transcript_59490/m.81283 type:complete len:169 (+) Transcript_59490:54-560(+)